MVLSLVGSFLPREPWPPITGERFAAIISRALGRNVHLRRIGEAVRALREEGLLIESGPHGYRVVTDPAKVAAWERREERRAKAILHALGARKRLDREEVERRIGQMGLFA